MNFFVRLFWRVFKKIIVHVRKGSFSSTGPLLNEEPLEEESLPFYRPQQYYNVKIGDVYEDQYQVVGKLGYGAYSTVWLCRDLCKRGEDEYLALKISTFLDDIPEVTYRESKVYDHISHIHSDHPGKSLIRQLHGTFMLGSHQCLLLSPMWKDMLELMAWKGTPLDAPLLKLVICRLLSTLDFLHTEAEVVHTDIKSDNIMLDVEDQAMLKRFEKEELQNPSPRKRVDATRNIYQSRELGRPTNGRYGMPILCDFGEARIGKSHETGPNVQPHFYRAPEVMFEMEWGAPIDIWSVACFTWDLFEGQRLFTSIFIGGKHDPFRHLAKIVGLIGPPPAEFVRRSETTDQCFDEEGQWIAKNTVPVVPITLEEMESRLEEGKEKDMFLRFMRRMLRWLPEERPTALELLQDPWLYEITHDNY